jgi:hypothetical protein
MVPWYHTPRPYHHTYLSGLPVVELNRPGNKHIYLGSMALGMILLPVAFPSDSVEDCHCHNLPVAATSNDYEYFTAVALRLCVRSLAEAETPTQS